MISRKSSLALTAVLSVAAIALTSCGADDSVAADNSIMKSTTRIASAPVVGAQRDGSTSCGPTAPMDDEGVTDSMREVTHARGTTTIPQDPRRIVVLDTDQLDTVCALGLQDRLVGAAVTDAGEQQPSYLGPTIAGVPSVGTVEEPSVEKISGLEPDLILGSQFRTPDLYAQLSKVAPTVFTDNMGPTWKDNVILDGTALGRGAAAKAALLSYQDEAAQVGRELNASQVQASIVRFTPGTIWVYGPDSFSGQVLGDVGVQRPAFQRLDGAQDRRSTEISEDELAQADGDLIYVSFDGEDGQSEGTGVMDGDLWGELGAAKDKRVFVVDDEIWMTGIGVAAARAILEDLRASLNAYGG